MPVYFEVRMPNAGLTSTTTQSRLTQGHECLVFFLGSTPSSTSHHPGVIQAVLCDGSVRYLKDEAAIIDELTGAPEGSAQTIIVGPSSQPGYARTRWLLTTHSYQLPSLGLTGAGGAAVLIGLLLPAVQAAREAAARKAPSPPAVEKLKALVGLGGHVFVLGSAGELLPA